MLSQSIEEPQDMMPQVFESGDGRRLKKPNNEYCSICLKIQDKDLSDLILCDGGCFRSFHQSCLGLLKLPEEDIWKCDDCRDGEQTCFLCGVYGTVNAKSDGVYNCRMFNCPMFYHLTCINSNPKAHFHKKYRYSNSFNSSNVDTKIKFNCPYHCCDICNFRDKRELIKCILCPKGFHLNCIPPTARYNQVALLCGEHKDQTLPGDEIVTVGDSGNFFKDISYPISCPLASNPMDINHFRLPQDLFASDLSSIPTCPPKFHMLRRNVYLKKVLKLTESKSSCVCTFFCGEDCINRVMQIECHGSGQSIDFSSSSSPLPFSNNSKALNIKRYDTNCNLSLSCGNRALQMLLYPKLECFYCGENQKEKGWGLRSPELIKAGSLVIEYMGEVIDGNTKEERLIQYRKDHPMDKNMYIMELGGNLFIDARLKGNLARFINHSCDPNCWLQKWTVQGLTRIAIIALRDISPLEELTYDYRFHTQQAADFLCCCKSSNCRGTLAQQKKLKVPNKPLTPKEEFTRMKSTQKKNRKHKLQKIKRLSLTSPFLPGTKIPIRNGILIADLHLAHQSHLFLRRNTRKGLNMLQRLQILEKRKKLNHITERSFLSNSFLDKDNLLS